MRHFPAPTTPDRITSVNGVGDTFLGVLIAGLAKGCTLDEPLISIAQEAACLTLGSSESVSPLLGRLKAKLRGLVLSTPQKPNDDVMSSTTTRSDDSNQANLTLERSVMQELKDFVVSLQQKPAQLTGEHGPAQESSATMPAQGVSSIFPSMLDIATKPSGDTAVPSRAPMEDSDDFHAYMSGSWSGETTQTKKMHGQDVKDTLSEQKQEIGHCHSPAELELGYESNMIQKVSLPEPKGGTRRSEGQDTKMQSLEGKDPLEFLGKFTHNIDPNDNPPTS